ncbi:CAZyme family GH2 [Paecilomyces variotii]|nr:CAZyme family GH2 [Paecilomyces variotii]KAJ9275123.1 CAZyme family GH2 [Paecilomyces variotii]KAJ9347210.1 CAZyme family GH2 [Paecilomyces variotii]KAJ9376911.1 CAZyme family GH2 [Paecilomyces variotii]
MASSATYPRPDFFRKTLNWTSLNEPWDLIFDDADSGLSELWQHKGIPTQAGAQKKRKINVPYAFQAPASGIGVHEAHEVLWYERIISDIRTADELAKGYHLIIRFGAVDYECSVWVDGQFVGGHRGGHVPFDLDISDAFQDTDSKKRARLTIRVRDSPYDLTQPRGKQFWGPVPESIFYTPTSGIWQSVWLESVPAMRLGSSSEGTILRSDDIERGELHSRVSVTGRRAASKCSVEIEARLGGLPVSKARAELPKDKEFVSLNVDMKVPNPDELRSKPPFNISGSWHDRVALWQPGYPILYDLTLRLYDAAGKIVDEVQTTTGMRSLSWNTGDGTFRVNNRPFFQVLVLDQGYWLETGMTPPSPEALKDDIIMSMNMGFNGCRKHQKVEDPIFLYWADRLGYLVWGEIANAYEFSDDYVQRFNSEWMEVVKRDINHPSIVTWTPVNESWAYTSLKDNIEQRNHIRSLYYMTKTLDPSRPINDNCGWEHVMTDLTTYHDYSDSPQLAESCSMMQGILSKKGGHDMFVPPIHSGSIILDAGAQHRPGAPVICTECGGVNIAPAKDASKGDRDWGYTTAADPKDLLSRLEKLIMAVVRGGHSCGVVYTQLADIEQEVNGLYSNDRREKVPAADVKTIMDSAKAHYYENVLAKHDRVKNWARRLSFKK